MRDQREDLLFWLRRAAARSEGEDRAKLLAASECIQANRILADLPDDFLFDGADRTGDRRLGRPTDV